MNHLHLPRLLVLVLTLAVVGVGVPASAAGAAAERVKQVPVAERLTAHAPGKAAPKRSSAAKARTRTWRRKLERRARSVASQQRGSVAAPKRRARAVLPAYRSAQSTALTAPLAAVVDGLNRPGLGPAGLRFEPDTSAAIGPEHLVQLVNGQGVGVFRRSDLGLVSRVDASTFLDGAAGEVIDPQVMWDQETQRWYYAFTRPTPAAFDPNRQGHLAYGWSKTSDPSDLLNGWCHLEISTGRDFDDNPKLADNASHLVIGSSVGSPSGNFARVFTIPKPSAGTTCPGSVSGIKTFGSASQPLRTASGVVVDWPVPTLGADGGATGWVLATEPQSPSTKLMLWSVGATGTLAQVGNITVRSYRTPSDAPQPAPYDTLDTQDNQVTQAVAMRDPDANAVAIWTAHTINETASGPSIVRWYELLPSKCTSTTCASATVRQQAEMRNSSLWIFNAAISPTTSGNEAVITYNTSGPTRVPEMRARSRTVGSKLSDMGPELTLDRSDAASNDGSCGPGDGIPACRWGDYSSAVPDFRSPHVVWGSNMAVGPQTPGVTHWRTRNFALRAGPGPVLLHGATSATDAAPGGDGDGVVEAGETVSVRESVRNAGDRAATGVTGTLTSNGSTATVPTGTSGWPDVPAGGAAQNLTPFRVAIASSAPCGAPVRLTLSLQAADGRHVVPVSVPVSSSGTAAAPGTASAATVAAADLPKAIPDGDPAGVTSSVAIADDVRIGDLDVTLGEIQHTWVGDLRVELTGPDGTTIVLANRPGGADNPGDGFLGTVFDDQATTPVAGGAAPYTGSFRPDQPLATFEGKSAKGTWTLRVIDLVALDKGTVKAWGATAAPPAIDKPGAVKVKATDVPRAIPDNSTAGVTSSLAVPAGAGNVGDLDVEVSGIRHTWVGDLRVELIGPDGTTAILADRPGGPNNAGDDLSATVFDDEASTVISAGTAPFRGSFKPQGTPLSTFDGKAATGTWRLKVADLGAQDTGTLDGWGTSTASASAPGC